MARENNHSAAADSSSRNNKNKRFSIHGKWITQTKNTFRDTESITNLVSKKLN